MEKTHPHIKDYIWMLYFIYITDSMLFATNADYRFIAFKRIITVIVAAFFIFSKVKNGDYRKNALILVLIFTIVFSMLFAGEIIGYMYITQIAVFFTAICYCLTTPREIYTKCFIDIIRVIAIASLIAFFLMRYVSGINLFPVIYNSVGESFRCLVLTNVPIGISLWQRNFGPFWEPGAFQFYLNVAFMFSLFRHNINSRVKYIDAVLFAFTCITTKSGASFVSLLITLTAYLLAQNKGEKKTAKGIIVLTVSVGMLYLLTTDTFSRTYEKVFYGLQSSDNVSFGYRLSSAITYVQGFFHSPIWGNSSEYLENLMKKNTYNLIGIYGSGNTNTILSYFAYYGGIVGFIILSNLYKSMLVISEKNKFIALILLISIVAATSNENFMCSILMSFLIFLNVGEYTYNIPDTEE